jgi:hypothetical protein
VLRLILTGNNSAQPAGQPPIVKWCLDYNWFLNGTPNKNFLGGDGPAFYDRFFVLNSKYRQLLQITSLPTNQIATFVPMILARYPVWGLRPVVEEGNWAVAAATIKLLPSSAHTAGT